MTNVLLWLPRKIFAGIYKIVTKREYGN